MNALSITRKFTFDAGHRIVGHESKCAHLHGHRYVAEVTVKGPNLDALGRVIDFGELKLAFGKWIDANWDHNMILCKDDVLLALDNPTGVQKEDIFHGKEPYIMPGGQNPTAENMAQELLVRLQIVLNRLVNQVKGTTNNRFYITHIRLHETENCWADVYADEENS